MVKGIKKRVKKITQAELLNQIITTQSRLARADFNLDAFMNLTVNQIRKLTPATGAVIELVEGKDMAYRAATGTMKKFVGLRLGINNSISGLCVKSAKVLRSDDTEKDSRVNLQACRNVGARSLVVAPLFHNQKTVGVLKIISNQVKGFSQTDIKTLQMMAGLVASALAHQMHFKNNKQLLVEKVSALKKSKGSEKRLKHLANHDHLTGLPNRSLLNSNLRSAMLQNKRTHHLIAVMYLDIDHFKSINDNLGHDIGDALLKAFSQRLKQCVREYDMVARFGGDEFVLLLNDLKKRADALAIAKKIVTKMRAPFTFKNKTLKITTSVGVAFLNGDDITSDQFIKQADQALYVSKESGRDRFSVFGN